MTRVHGRGTPRVVLAIAVTTWAILALMAGTAGADVNEVSGSAFGVSIPPIVAEQASVSFQNPSDGPGPFTDFLPSFQVPSGPFTAFSATGMSVSTGQVGALGTHAGGSESSANVASFALSDSFTGDGIHSECRSSGDGSSGSTTISRAFFGASPVSQSFQNYSPPPNTTFATGFGETIILNEQTFSDGPGTTGIVVNAVRIDFGNIDIVIGQSACRATGPDVLAPESPHTTLTITPDVRSGLAPLTVVFTYTETNDGTIPLTNVTVTDDTCAPVTFVDGDDGDGVLAPGETWRFTCTQTVTGRLAKRAIATGTDPAGATHVEQAVTEVLGFVSFQGFWRDPSGTVCTTGRAEVTLLRSDAAAGPFEAVPAGSDIMSPDNRDNPDTPGPDGRFRWDVIDGFYIVRLVSLDTGESVETDAFPVPPEVTDLVLTLPCPPASDPDRPLPAPRYLALTGGPGSGALVAWGIGLVAFGLLLLTYGRFRWRRILCSVVLAISLTGVLVAPASASHQAYCISNLYDPTSGLTFTIGPVYLPPSATGTFVGAINSIAGSLGFIPSSLCVSVPH